MSHILLPSQKPMVPYVLSSKDQGYRVRIEAYIFVPTGIILRCDAEQYTYTFGPSRTAEFNQLTERTPLFLGEWFVSSMSVDPCEYEEYGKYAEESLVKELFHELGSKMVTKGASFKEPFMPTYKSPLEVIYEKLSSTGPANPGAGSGTHSAVHDDCEPASPDYPTIGKRPW